MISLLTLNVEGTKHLDTQLAFLQQHSTDIVCLQEVFACSLPAWRALGYHVFFQAYADVKYDTRYPVQVLGEWGIAILTRVPTINYQVVAYHGSINHIPVYSHPLSVNRVVQIVTVHQQEQDYHIANTHFTWTPDGQANDEQIQHLPRLLAALDNYPQHVLVGDFNAPRGRDIWQKLAQQYQDNIPPAVTTTLDASRHYRGQLELVVDGIFTTPAYRVNNVHLHTGVSDHYAIRAEVECRSR